MASDGSIIVAGCADGYVVTWSIADLHARPSNDVIVHTPLSLMKPRSAVPIDTVCVLRRRDQAVTAASPYYVVAGAGNNSAVQVFRLSASVREMEVVQSLTLKSSAPVRWGGFYVLIDSGDWSP